MSHRSAFIRAIASGLVRILKGLRDNGNAVVVVEHDPEIIREADHIIDMGPLAGEKGGEVVFAGPYEKILADKRSLTGKYLSGRVGIAVPRKRRVRSSKKQHADRLSVHSANNLKDLTVAISHSDAWCVSPACLVPENRR